MFSNFFADVPDTADSIPEPLKEDGDINPNATKIHITSNNLRNKSHQPKTEDESCFYQEYIIGNFN